MVSSPQPHVDTQGNRELFNKDAVHLMLICAQKQQSWLVTQLVGRVSKAEAFDCRLCAFVYRSTMMGSKHAKVYVQSCAAQGPQNLPHS